MVSNQTVTVELRSDTFTKPSKEMLQYMTQAEVGDSIYDEDPTITELETKTAALFGKEAALFMPSGTMANLVGLMVHCMDRGSEIIVGDKSHLNMWEQGGISQVGHIYVKQISNLEDGTFDLSKLENMISDHSDRCCAHTKVVCLENSQNWCGGRILPLEFVEKCAQLCKKYNMKLHLDGSRIMNVSAATNIDVKTLCQYCDTINFCFSKGLGAPVGSILIGTNDFIKKAVRVRQSLGGGMRQAGVLAAACLYGLTQADKNLRLDTQNAKRLVQGIAYINNGVFSVNVETTETNIVHMSILKNSVTVSQLITRLATVTENEQNELKKSIIVKVGEVDKRTVRLLTHLDVNTEQIDLAIEKIKYVSNEYVQLD